MTNGINELIFHASLHGIKVGTPLSLYTSKKLEQWKHQNGDSHAVHGYKADSLYYEIESVDEVVTSISAKLYQDTDKSYSLCRKPDEACFQFGFKANFVELIQYLNDLRIKWKIDKVETGQKAIGLVLESHAKIMYSFEEDFFGFYQVLINRAAV